MVSTTDVAKYAGVSQTTVSRVLNKPDQVKKETYNKVMAAVNELNYSADAKEEARPPITKTKTISLIAGAVDDPIFIGAAPAIISYAKERGYHVNVHFVGENSMDAYNTALASRADGLVVASVLLNDSIHEKLIHSNIPFILMNSSYKNSQHSIGLNNEEAGYLATSYLLAGEHEEIAWVGGKLDNPTYKERFTGFIHALQEAGSKIRKKRLVIADTDKSSLQEAFNSLQELKKKPTAIVAATDEIAIQLMDFYKEAGYQIPKDISIIGIGNSEIGQHSVLSLTSVGSADDLANLGQETIKRLFDRITLGQDEAFNVNREVCLFKRNTTG